MAAARLAIAVVCLLAALLAAAPANARAENSPPTCQDAGPEQVYNDAFAISYLGCSDPDGDALTYSVVDGPAHGSLGTITSGSWGANVSYRPAAGYVGDDQITFKATDGSSDSNVATHTYHVVTPPPPQCTQPAAFTMRPDHSYTFSLYNGNGGCSVTDADF